MGAADGTFGELIARGNTSDVWSWTPETVVKILHPGIPGHWAAVEADITSLVHAAGLPVPAVDGVIEVDGCPAVVFERVDGETMWDRMKASSDQVPALLEVFVDVQVDVHAASPITGLPDLGTRLRRKIDEVTLVADEDRGQARALLAGLPSGAVVCHGDMHPANIVMSPRGMIIVDWFDAAIGHAAADYTRSSLLLRPPEADTSKSGHLDGATSSFLELVHCAYLSALVRRALIEPASFAAWEAVLAVARMAEPVPTDDLAQIWGRWQAGGPEASSQSLERCLERPAEQTTEQS